MPRDRYFARHVPSDARLQRWNPYFEKYSKGNKAWYYFTGTHANLKEWKEDIKAGVFGRSVPNWRNAVRWVSNDSRRYSNYKDRPYFGYSRGAGLAESLGGTGYGGWTARGFGGTARTKSAIEKPADDFLHNFGVKPVSNLIEGFGARTRMVRHGNYIGFKRTRSGARIPRGRSLGQVGTYHGRFSGGRRVRSKPSMYASKGFQGREQLFGEQAQTDCAWIGLRSVKERHIFTDLAVALIRYIWAKHFGMTFTDCNCGLNPGGSTSVNKLVDSIDFIIVQYPISGGEPIYTTHKIETSNYSVYTFATFICNYVFNCKEMKHHDMVENGRGILKYYRVNRGLTDGNIISDADQDIEQMYVKAYSRACMTIQNVTEANVISSGNPHDKNRVDANPICGKTYSITNSLPIIRGTSWMGNQGSDSGRERNEYLLAQDPNDDGIIFPQADLQAAYRLPVPPQYFEKVSRSSNVSLAPGGMKSAMLRFKFDGKINALIHGLADADTSGGRLRDALGTCELFAFQKRMRTGSNVIHVGWQADYRHGVCIKKVVRPIMNQVVSMPAQTTNA